MHRHGDSDQNPESLFVIVWSRILDLDLVVTFWITRNVKGECQGFVWWVAFIFMDDRGDATWIKVAYLTRLREIRDRNSCFDVRMQIRNFAEYYNSLTDARCQLIVYFRLCHSKKRGENISFQLVLPKSLIYITDKIFCSSKYYASSQLILEHLSILININ